MNIKRLNKYRIKTSKGGEKHYYVKADGRWIEVDKAVYRLLDSTERRQQYLDNKRIIKKDISLDYLNQLLEHEGTNKTAMLIANAHTPETILLAKESNRMFKEMLDYLPGCIKTLSEQDKALIEVLFFSDISESEYARILGVARKSLYTRKKRILAILRKALVERIGYLADGGDLYDE